MKVAVLFNSFAGKQIQFHQFGKRIAEVFYGHTLLTCSEGLGEHYLAPHVADLQIAVCQEETFVERIHEAAKQMTEEKPDLIVCIGGDGFIAYTADWMVRHQVRIPLLGIAGGTANVGPLIRFTEQNLEQLTPEKLRYAPVGAVEVRVDDQVLGYAFNDVIIGNTFLGSEDGKMVNIAADSFLQDGSKRVVFPSSDILGEDFQLLKNRQPVKHKLQQVAQMIISPLQQRSYYRGKAIAGLLCQTGFSEDSAAVGFCDRILVNANDSDDGPTALMEHLLFKQGDVIEMRGFTENGFIIIDGNPFPRPSGTVTFRQFDDLVTCTYTE